jgi:hypothetical protein
VVAADATGELATKIGVDPTGKRARWNDSMGSRERGWSMTSTAARARTTSTTAARRTSPIRVLAS